MVTKTTKTGRTYEIDGRRLTWHAAVWEDEGEAPFDITIPLRMRLGVLRPLAQANLEDVGAMFDLLEGVIPDQADKLDQLDVNDFAEMFTTWQDEYTTLNGASLGESVGSST